MSPYTAHKWCLHIRHINDVSIYLCMSPYTAHHMRHSLLCMSPYTAHKWCLHIRNINVFIHDMGIYVSTVCRIWKHLWAVYGDIFMYVSIYGTPYAPLSRERARDIYTHDEFVCHCASRGRESSHTMKIDSSTYKRALQKRRCSTWTCIRTTCECATVHREGERAPTQWR